MWLTITLIFGLYGIGAWARTTPFVHRHKRTTGPLSGAKCVGISVQNAGEVQPYISQTDQSSQVPWVDSLLNDPNVLCGWLLSGQSQTDAFELPGFTSQRDAFYIPALWELFYYTDSVPQGQPNAGELVQDGLFTLTVNNQTHNISAFPPSDSSKKYIMSARNSTFSLSWSEQSAHLVNGTTWFLKMPYPNKEETLTPPAGGIKIGPYDTCPYIFEPEPDLRDTHGCFCHKEDEGCYRLIPDSNLQTEDIRNLLTTPIGSEGLGVHAIPAR